MMARPTLRLPTGNEGNTMHAMTLPKRHESVDCSLLPALLEMYLEAKRRENAISARTETNYRGQIAPFLQWFSARPDKQLTPDAFAEFLTWMRGDFQTRFGQAPAANTTAHCITRLKGLLNWCYRQNCTGGVNLADWLPQVRKVQSRLYFPDAGEMVRLFAAVRGVDRLRLKSSARGLSKGDNSTICLAVSKTMAACSRSAAAL